MIVALHGFLGRPSDWNGILPDEALKPDLFSPDFGIPEGEILIGYSLGGRLALQNLHKYNYKAAVIISSHPGLDSEEEMKARREHDEKWAKRFESDPWDILMKDWNGQGVFSGHEVQRKEEDYDRKGLADALRKWSLGSQKKVDLAAFDLPILWMTGEKDSKFNALSKTIALTHRQSKIITVPGSGHRVPWEQPADFQWHLNKFLGEIA